MKEQLGRSPTSQSSTTQEVGLEEEEVDQEFIDEENMKRTTTHNPSHGSHKPLQGKGKEPNLKKNQKGQAAKRKRKKLMELIINGQPSLLRLSMNKFQIRYEKPFVQSYLFHGHLWLYYIFWKNEYIKSILAFDHFQHGCVIIKIYF